MDVDLEKASEIYAHETLERLPANEEIRKMHRFSDRFRKNMAKIMRGMNEKEERVRHKSRLIRLGNNAQRFVAAILIFVVLSITVSISVDAVREPLFDMTEIVFKDHVDLIPREYMEQYQNEHLIGDALLEHYISKLEAQGYRKVNESTYTDGDACIEFKKEEHLILYQMPYDSNDYCDIDYEIGEYKSLSYSGKKFRYSMKKHVIYWEDEDALYLIKCEINEAELLDIIRNMF